MVHQVAALIQSPTTSVWSLRNHIIEREPIPSGCLSVFTCAPWQRHTQAHRGTHTCRGTHTLLMLTSFHSIPAEPSLGRGDHEVITPRKLATKAGAELVSLWVWWRALSSWHLDVPRVDVCMWGTEQSFRDSRSQVLNHRPVKYLLVQLGNFNRSRSWEGAIRRTIASNRAWEGGKGAFRKSTNKQHTLYGWQIVLKREN